MQQHPLANDISHSGRAAWRVFVATGSAGPHSATASLYGQFRYGEDVFERSPAQIVAAVAQDGCGHSALDPD